MLNFLLHSRNVKHVDCLFVHWNSMSSSKIDQRYTKLTIEDNYYGFVSSESDTGMVGYKTWNNEPSGLYHKLFKET